MNIRLTLAAPLPWLTSVAKLISKNKKIKKSKISLFILPRTLSFTREGIRFIAILFVIGIAAINTGNNLLYLVVAMMLSLIIISGILSESTLRGIDIYRTLPKHIFTGRSAIAKLTASNQKRFLPSFSLIIEEAPSFSRPIKSYAKEFDAVSGYILKLPAQASLTQIQSYVFQKRGFYKLRGLTVKTRFPFGFFLKERRIEAPIDVVVYPRLKPMKRVHSAGDISHGLNPALLKGQGTHLYNIRDYTPADDSRIIHWKSSAKAAKLMAKEFEQEKKKTAKIVFYNALLPLPNFDDTFEGMVEKAASLAEYYIRSGFEVGFKSLTADLPCKSGREQLYRILKELALIEPVASNKNVPLAIKVIVP
ncbi:MAG: DUF58 domain-containing protein [Deltaproteobacteria bacterium]|nr:DUF58 domain-containing protein [Deltaproteobacteria bacterium]